MKDPIVSPRVYVSTFAALMALLGATVAIAYVDLGELNLPIALTISVAKTLLIILFFMHVRHGSRLTWTFAGAGFFWLMILLCLAMADYSTRRWEPRIPFQGRDRDPAAIANDGANLPPAAPAAQP